MNEYTREDLLRQIEELKIENESLKSQVPSVDTEIVTQNGVSSFTLEEYKRYGRQMIVPVVGIAGQVKLKNSKILVIGAGGLGCPALLYLTAAGVGKIGIVDNDIVDVSNLHRQVLHTSDNVDMFKCDSAKKYLNKLNPYVDIKTYPLRLTNDNIFEIFEADDWDLILDCTDTPLTRYLINDAAVICGICIVSGSGVKTDGQLSILNFKKTGPCYRCFYPKPPPPNSVLSCKDGGVIGPAIGIMGTMMALETIKIICGEYDDGNFKPFLNLYTGLHNQSLRCFKMRGKVANCESCGDNPKITRELIENGLNYSEWCGKLDYDVVSMTSRIGINEFASAINDKSDYVILDVRPVEQFDICHLPNSISKPLDDLEKITDLSQVFDSDVVNTTIYCICRFGNDSRLATKFLKEKFHLSKVYDVIGGLNKWSEDVDVKFPKY